MKLIKKYKNISKLLFTILLVSLMSIVSTLEGYIYANNGMCYSIFIIEFITLIIMVALFNIFLCTHEDGKCITIKKQD